MRSRSTLYSCLPVNWKSCETVVLTMATLLQLLFRTLWLCLVMLFIIFTAENCYPSVISGLSCILPNVRGGRRIAWQGQVARPKHSPTSLGQRNQPAPTDTTGENCCTAKKKCLKGDVWELSRKIYVLIKDGFIYNLFRAFQPQIKTFLQLNHVSISLDCYYNKEVLQWSTLSYSIRFVNSSVKL